MANSSGQVAHVLQALSDPTRLRAVEVLSRGPRWAGDLAGELGVSAPVMSKHLRVRLEAGLVEDERPAGDARSAGHEEPRPVGPPGREQPARICR